MGDVILTVFCLFYAICGLAYVYDELHEAHELPPWRHLAWQVPLVFMLWPIGVCVRARKGM